MLRGDVPRIIERTASDFGGGAMPQATIPSGPRGHFLLGCLPDYARDTLGFMTGVARRYGDAVRFRLGRLPCYMFSHPDQVEEVLRSKSQHFIKDKPLRIAASVFGRGLLTSEGDLWRRQRRLIQPAFLGQQVRGHAPAMVEAAGRMLETWRDGQVRDVHADLMRATLDIVARCLFGADLGERADGVVKAVGVLSDHFLSPLFWSTILRWLPAPSNVRFHRAVRLLDGLVYDLIRRGRAGGIDRGCLLARLLEAQRHEAGRLTDRQLRDEMVTLLLAGHETTALALSYAFYLLATHPEAEARLVAELQEVLGDRTPTAEDVPRLRYAEWVIKEAMRLYPPAWGLGREAVVDCEIGGYRVPKGTQVLTIQWIVHRDPRWYDDPESFRPERWADDLERRLPRGAYFPFGDGPRICIGQQFAMLEAVLVLAAVARSHRLMLVDDEPLELVASITMRPKRGMPMRVERREAPGSEAGVRSGQGEAT
jgi:cytochrome P450